MATVGIFTLEYLLRLYAIGEEPCYSGFKGRLWWIVSVFSLIDLASIIPFYVDLGLAGNQLSSTTFIRLFRVFRMMRSNGRFVEVRRSTVPRPRA